MKPEILFIAHRMPFPPDRGDKIRSHHILHRLARIASVHVATFADSDADLAEEGELAALAMTHRLVRRNKPLILAGVQAVASGKPVSLPAFFDPALAEYVEQVLRDRPIATIFVFSGQMGQYVPAVFTGRVVADFVDVDSAKFEAYAAKRKGPMRWVEAREGRLLRNVEAQLAERAQVSVLISDEEATLFSSRLTPSERGRTDIRVLRNGTDSRYLNPAIVVPEPRLAQIGGPKLIFTGQMDYAPNASAAVRVAERIMPLVRKACPAATFHVVGRNPTHAVTALHGVNGTHVWGEVADVRPWLKGADLAIVPLEIARGVQNKVLEAMAMALPVVLTSASATGISATDGEHFVVADEDAALAQAVIRLAEDKAAAKVLGAAARRYVIEELSWETTLATLPAIVGLSPQPVRDAA